MCAGLQEKRSPANGFTVLLVRKKRRASAEKRLMIATTDGSVIEREIDTVRVVVEGTADDFRPVGGPAAAAAAAPPTLPDAPQIDTVEVCRMVVVFLCTASLLSHNGLVCRPPSLLFLSLSLTVVVFLPSLCSGSESERSRWESPSPARSHISGTPRARDPKTPSLEDSPRQQCVLSCVCIPVVLRSFFGLLGGSQL